MPGAFGRRTVVVSSLPSAACACHGETKSSAPAEIMAVRKRRRVCLIGIETSYPRGSRLQLAFELVEEAPIGAVGDDLLRARLDEPHFVQPKRIIPETILGIVFVPFIVGKPAQRLQRVVIASSKTTIDEAPRDTCRFGGAKVGGFEDGPHYAFGCDGVSAHVFAVAGEHTAEILRPGAVHGGVDDHMPDAASAEILRLRRKAEECVDLSLREELGR